MFPDEPGVNPRSNNERPRRQISSRVFASLMASYLKSTAWVGVVSRFGSAAKP
jgi:predicted small integral membrane protein